MKKLIVAAFVAGTLFTVTAVNAQGVKTVPVQKEHKNTKQSGRTGTDLKSKDDKSGISPANGKRTDAIQKSIGNKRINSVEAGSDMKIEQTKPVNAAPAPVKK